MADKETKQKSTDKKTSTAESKSSAKSATKNATEKIAASKTTETAKTNAANPVKKTTKRKNAEDMTFTEKVVSKYSNSKGKPVKRELVSARKAAAATPEGIAAKRLKTQNILLWVLIGILIASLIAGVVLGSVYAASKTNVPYQFTYKSAQAVGYYSEQLGTVARVKPVSEVKDGGLASGYPVYGQSMSSVLGTSSDKVAARQAIIRESSYLTATGTTNAGGGQYTWMDKDGYLYSGSVSSPVPTIGTDGQQRQLYKHSASIGMYGGNVADDEPGVIKQVTLRPRGYTSYSVTGVYAPAGEVIKVQMSGADMDATGGLVFHIGQALYNGKSNNIWDSKNQMQRMPNILNTMSFTKQTATYDETTDTWTGYIGSFLGGPVYIRNETVTFTATISGAVNYRHFILGYTTPDEFEELSKSSAPYFDLEVWSYGVLHSGPKQYAARFDYDDLYKAAILWEKVALVSTTGSLQGIVFLYDPFVAAGAAVAFPGQCSVNCPASWMTSSLDYNGIVNSGSWGNFHEYHHNFQGYGVGDGGEVTNNGMTLVSYSLFTKVSAARQIGNIGAAGLSDWNCYTSATWALEETLKIARADAEPSNGNKGLALYATLLHNFGPDNYIQAKLKQRTTSAYGENYSGYMQAWQDTVHYNMAYYFNDILKGGVPDNLGNNEYPMFIPVSSVYQTGRGLTVNGNTEYFETMQPYVIPYGDEFTIDLRKYSAPSGQYAQGSIIVPDGFSFNVKDVSQPENGGTIKDNGDGTYSFKPGKDLRTGKIIVTLELIPSDSFKAKYPDAVLEDVKLALEFEQTHEKNKTVLDRTIYTYAADKMYADAEAAYKADFKGYSDKQEIAHSNPTQNCNTDIWFVNDNADGHAKFPNALDFQIAKDNVVSVITGKLYAETAGKYRIYLRGRFNCAVYYSIDGGKTYQLGATIKDSVRPDNSDKFRPNDENTYFDLELVADSWIYFKEVLISQTIDGYAGYIGLGMKQWAAPLFSTQTVTNADGTETTKYFNEFGVEVTESEANNAELQLPKVTNASQPYVNAYKASYEKINKEFTSDYFYTRSYTKNYADNVMVSEGQKVINTNYDKSKCWGSNWTQYDTMYLTDGNKNTIVHTKDAWGASESKAIYFIIDLGEVKSVNRMTIYTQNRPNGDWHYPRDFNLEYSVDGREFTLIGEYRNTQWRNLCTSVDFDETEMRYYRFTSVGSPAGLMIISEIEMWRVFEVNGAEQIAASDSRVQMYGNWQAQQTHATFGQVAVGKRNARVEMEFEGTRVGIVSSKAFATNYEVYVDGKKMDCLPQLKPLADQDGDFAIAYLSSEFEQGTHKLTIKCVGEANIDSILIYP